MRGSVAPFCFLKKLQRAVQEVFHLFLSHDFNTQAFWTAFADDYCGLHLSLQLARATHVACQWRMPLPLVVWTIYLQYFYHMGFSVFFLYVSTPGK